MNIYLLLNKYKAQLDYGNIIDTRVKHILPLYLLLAKSNCWQPPETLADRGGKNQALGELALISGGLLKSSDNHVSRPSPRKRIPNFVDSLRGLMTFFFVCLF